MAAKFELKKSKNDKFVFNLLATNGQVILTSEMYESRARALGGVESVRKNAPDDARYGRLSAKDGSPYFTLKAANGQVVGQSQMYSGERARDAGIESVKHHAPAAVLNDTTA
ncbi:YegP family protein [Acidovorax sp. SRB_24]|uniref:YegP family protein n=1 Tax=Acidovorax sp. SRB_24 TaxID=1962700 RepID=UPI00145D41F6|nr:YegP family protein [Acidovorax sp. SRB_24]NMM75952.1 hypothetical protein [Acidovorax sp. SRB_24]